VNAVATELAHAIPNERLRIEALRGLACLLLVSFHVIGEHGGGIRASDQSLYRDFTNLFLHLRMPLFAFLSGFVYAYRPIHDWKIFAGKKIQRLLVPLLVVSTVFFIVQQIAPGTNKPMPWASWWKIYLYPYVHFWFLQSILVIFAGLAILEHHRALSSLRKFVAVFALVLCAHFWAPEVRFFSLSLALYLAPFFLLGLGMNRFQTRLNATPVKALVLAAALTLMTLHVGACVNGDVAERGCYFATALSLASVMAALYLMPSVSWLAWVGKFSFAIYLYHVFFSAGMRIALNKIHITNIELHFVLGCVLAIAGPILIELAAKRYKLSRRVLLGQS
jgi:glucan biosynthesis protein C